MHSKFPWGLRRKNLVTIPCLLLLGAELACIETSSFKVEPFKDAGLKFLSILNRSNHFATMYRSSGSLYSILYHIVRCRYMATTSWFPSC